MIVIGIDPHMKTHTAVALEAATGVPLTMLLFEFFVFGVAIAGTVFWIWMLIDCATNEPSAGNDKLMWVLIILFTHMVGAIIYYFVRRPQRKGLYGQ